MTELVFPSATLLITFAVVVPVLSAASLAALSMWRRRGGALADFAGPTMFALLAGPAMLPLLWLVSAAWHASASGSACVLSHSAVGCIDDVLLLMGGLVVVVGALAWRLWRELPRLPRMRGGHDAATAARVQALCAREPALRGARVSVTAEALAPVYTVGLVRPRIVMDAAYVRACDDATVRAALLHEAGHVHAWDVLRLFAVRLGLALNPMRAAFGPWLARFQSACELRADSWAVAQGADPLALAHAIVTAAQHTRAVPTGAAALAGEDARVLKLRLTLLMGGEQAPFRPSRARVLLAGLFLCAALPHHGFASLDVFHVALERALLLS